MCLKHPIGIFGVGDDEVVPFDLEMSRRSLEEWRAREVGDV